MNEPEWGLVIVNQVQISRARKRCGDKIGEGEDVWVGRVQGSWEGQVMELEFKMTRNDVLYYAEITSSKPEGFSDKEWNELTLKWPVFIGEEYIKGLGDAIDKGACSHSVVTENLERQTFRCGRCGEEKKERFGYWGLDQPQETDQTEPEILLVIEGGVISYAASKGTGVKYRVIDIDAIKVGEVDPPYRDYAFEAEGANIESCTKEILREELGDIEGAW